MNEDASALMLKLIKEEPPDGEQHSGDEIVINGDIVTYLDVTLENDSDTSDDDSYGRDRDRDHSNAFTCNICEHNFKTYRSLLIHSAIHTQQEFAKKSVCTICQKRFDARELAYHFRTHDVVKSHRCFYCDCAYFTQSQLDTHVRTHAGHTCNKCRAIFRTETDLKQHYKTHVEELLYACNICDQTFSTTENLSRHISTHKKKRKLNTFL